MRMSSQNKQRTWLEDISFKEDGVLLPSPPIQARSSQQHTLLRSSPDAVGRPPPSIHYSVAFSESQEFSIVNGSCNNIVNFMTEEMGSQDDIMTDLPATTHSTDEHVLEELKAFLNNQSISSRLPSSGLNDMCFHNGSENTYQQTLENVRSIDFDLYGNSTDGSNGFCSSEMEERIHDGAELPLFPQLHQS